MGDFVYKALYRKWRPRVFEDVIGQDHITNTLKNQILLNRVGHAYLFVGTRGTGKTTCAKIFAQAINCKASQNGDPCNKCDICLGVQEGSILDILEIDAASNNGVDNIRDIRDESAYSPAVCDKKVYIIDEAHMLSAGAANALLKILEEPPAHVMFILATTEFHKIPATILSRCQRFDFKRIPTQLLSDYLLEISKKETLALDKNAAMDIAISADGSVRDALSILERCSSLTSTIDSEVVDSCLGLTAKSDIVELCDFIAKKDIRGALDKFNSLYMSGNEITSLCEQLITYCKDLLLFSAASVLPESVISEHIKRQAPLFKQQTLVYMADTLSDTLGRMSRSFNKKADFEICLFKLINPQGSQSFKAEPPLSGVPFQKSLPREEAPAPPHFEAIRSEKISEESSPAVSKSNSEDFPQEISLGDNITEKPFNLLGGLISKLTENGKMIIVSCLKNCTAKIGENSFILETSNEYSAENLSGRDAIKTISDALSELTGVSDMKIQICSKDEKKKPEVDPFDDLIRIAKSNPDKFDLN